MQIPAGRRSHSDTYQSLTHPFGSLWPHRFDYLFAPHPNPGESPSWQTESRYPLSDRLLLQSAFLYGVRHGPKTSYALLDIDSGSPYHPRRDPIAFYRLRTALEALGLVTDIILTSSDSDGIHIYLPINGKVASWKLGTAITAVLENAGFKVIPWLARSSFLTGSLMLPMARRRSSTVHRLPLQHGSYLLNDNLEPTHNSQEAFCHQWDFATKRNTLSTRVMNGSLSKRSGRTIASQVRRRSS